MRRSPLAACRAGDTPRGYEARPPRPLFARRPLYRGRAHRPLGSTLSLGWSVYDPTDVVGRLLFNVLAVVAEFEADLIRLRTREEMKVAKAKGHLRGKQPKLSRRQEAHLVSLVRSEEYSTAEVAELFGVARSTVYRAIERERDRALGNDSTLASAI